MIMMRKLMHNTAVAAGFAALLLTGACASHNAVATEPTDEVVQVTQTETTVSTPETAMVDSNGSVIAEPATVAESTVTVTNSPLVEPGSTPDTTATALTTTTTTTQTTTVAAPMPAPMTSSSNLDTQTTTSTTDDTTATTETETRTRLRKD
jgi:hypothetical protein